MPGMISPVGARGNGPASGLPGETVSADDVYEAPSSSSLVGMGATDTERVTEDESKGKTLKATCERCSRETNHRVLKSVETYESSEDYDIHEGGSFQIIECAGCGWISFRQMWWSSEVREQVDDLEGPPIENFLLFPPRRKGIRWLEHEHYLPPTIRQLYKEKMYALTNDQPILTGIAIRALVEAVCSHYGATARGLKARVEELAAKGKLSEDQKQSLHGCRCLGNDAAHEANVPTDEELEIANDIADGLLKAAFIHPFLRERLPKDKPPKAKPPKVPSP